MLYGPIVVRLCHYTFYEKYLRDDHAALKIG